MNKLEITVELKKLRDELTNKVKDISQNSEADLFFLHEDINMHRDNGKVEGLRFALDRINKILGDKPNEVK